MDDQLKSNITAPNTWLRLLLMVLFGFCASVALWLVWIVAVLQFFFSLITGRINENVDQFAAVLTAYLAELLAFLVYRSDERPFPFAPLPAANDLSVKRGQNDSAG